MFEQMVVGLLSKVMEAAFDNPNITVDNLYIAISEDKSLWGEGESTIKQYSDMIPGWMKTLAVGQIENVNQKYGGVSVIAQEWIRENRPELFSLILNTPGGVEWLDRQVDEILKGVGITT
jgi:hypothetical protein